MELWGTQPLIEFGEASEGRNDAFFLCQALFFSSTSQLQFVASWFHGVYVTKLYVLILLSKNKETIGFLPAKVFIAYYLHLAHFTDEKGEV